MAGDLIAAAGGLTLHRRRFIVVYVAVAVAVVAAVVGFVLLVGRGPLGGSKHDPTWSAWHPTGGGLGAAAQIAEHVAATYRLENGSELVAPVARGPDLTASVPIPVVAVRNPNGPDDVHSLSSDDTIVYLMCGLGPNCAIASGTPSVERETLVRREVLELALYTFEYIPRTKYVVAFMPPAPGKKATDAVYLEQSDLERQLKVPLARTLAATVPPSGQIPPAEQERIDSLTQTRTYTFAVQRTQLGEPILVLSPL